MLAIFHDHSLTSEIYARTRPQSVKLSGWRRQVLRYTTVNYLARSNGIQIMTCHLLTRAVWLNSRSCIQCPRNQISLEGRRESAEQKQRIMKTRTLQLWVTSVIATTGHKTPVYYPRTWVSSNRNFADCFYVIWNGLAKAASLLNLTAIKWKCNRIFFASC